MARTTRNQGIALIGVVMMLAFLMALAATLAVSVNLDTRLRGAFGQSMTGFYAAESGLNQGMAEFKTKFLDYQVPTGSDFDLRSSTLGQRGVTYQLTEKPGNPKSVTIPAGQLFAGLNSQQYTYTVNSQATNANTDVEASVGAEFLVGNIPLFQFVAFYDGDLEILPGQNMTLRGRVHTNGNLYLNAESGKTLAIVDNYATGITTVQVSAKGDIHRGRKNNTACNLGTVTIDKLEDIVAPKPNDLDPQNLNCIGSTSAKVPLSTIATWKGSIVSQIQSISVPEPDIINRPPQSPGIYWQRADLRIALRLTTNNTLWQQPPFGGLPLPHTIEVQDASGNQDVAKTALLYTFMTSLQNTGTYTNGAVSSAPRVRPIFYTDVPVTTGAPNNCNCTNSNATGCTIGVAACYNPTFAGASVGTVPTAVQNQRVHTTNNYNLPNGMLGDLDYRRGGFYNWREKKWMLLLNINLGDLLEWNRRQPAGNQLFSPGDTTDGGLVIYASVVGPASGTVNNYGVRIFGAQNLWFPTAPGPGVDPTGVTFVSDQAVYVQGNFNQGNVAPAPGTNLPEQPAAIIADSINVLSNAYFNMGAVVCTNDCQSITGLTAGSRNGTATTINAAFLAGVDETQGSAYNGGLENYPRFHENWGATLTYLGSFVSLGTPAHVNGSWCGTGTTCNIYNPPTRQYDYDPAFNSAANLPPLTPRFVYVQQVLFTEDFK